MNSRTLVLTTLLLVGANFLESAADNVVNKKIKTADIAIKVYDSVAYLAFAKNDGTTFQIQFNTKTPNEVNSNTLTLNVDCEINTTCISLKNETTIKIRTDPDSEVIHISRSISNSEAQLTDCFSLYENYTQWFGGPEIRYQRWPVQDAKYDEVVYVPTSSNNMAVAERYWLSSEGVYVFVDASDPLFLDQNHIKDRYLCLVAKNKTPYRKRNIITLKYEIGVFDDPRIAHEHVVENHFGKPTGHPNKRMVTHPIWSTWARYKDRINDTAVRKFADEIIEYGFKNSQLEIDDNWESCYGSFNFNTTKFPDIGKLLADLKAKNFRVTLWIHPFINKGCNDGDEAYDQALANGYFVKNTDGNVHTTWWQGGNGAGAIDFTNPKAVEWWVGRVKKLQALGIDSFKFDAGEESWLPQPPNLTGPEELQPGIFTYNYSSILARYFDDNIEVRVGWRTQHFPIFVRMLDKDTRWDFDNGLPTLITTLLQMNLNGYGFVLPDMIGGNGYANGLTGIELPSKQMFIRWLQANVFMPSLQYSFTPWDFDKETIGIAKTFTDMHAEISPKILELMKKAVRTGAPINPPIWWVDPKNVDAHKVNDEYLLGEEILVAPVTKENATARDVFLPAGNWKDGNTQTVHEGPIWLRNYAAPLTILPYFYKI